MDSGTLLETLKKLNRIEDRFQIQTALQAVATSLANLASSPNDGNVQLRVAEAVSNAEATLNSASNELTPSDLKRLDELNGRVFFSPEFGEEISGVVREAGITPAVAQQRVASAIGKRQDFISNVSATASNLERLGVAPETLEPGEAEVGFQLPRELFRNELAPLIDELRVLRRIIRVFSEIATGSAEPIEVRQISSTDPSFFFGLKVVTVGMIGKAASWALDQWKKVEEIRKLRAETAKLGEVFGPDDIKQMFDERIDELVRKAIKERVDELVPVTEGQAGRKHEQRIDLAWALEAILSRVERGMTVEVRMLPPPTDAAEVADAQRIYETLKEVQEQLIFPEPTGTPVLGLVHMPNAASSDDDNGPKAKPKKDRVVKKSAE